MIIGLASDHAGYELKEHLKSFLSKNKEYETINFGCNNNQDPVNYPEFAELLCTALKQGKVSKGILVCGSGQGMAMAANRYTGIRAALCYNQEIARLAKSHNNANIICLGCNFLEKSLAESITITWLKTEFEKGRHQTRINLI